MRFYGGDFVYKNDNDKKFALAAAILAMLLFTLVSCGKQMAELKGSAKDVVFRVYSRAGINTDSMYHEEFQKDSAYTLGISEESFEENVEEAHIYRPSELNPSKSIFIVIAKNKYGAEDLYNEIYEDYDWAPCDPADQAVFMLYDKYILMAKDDDEEIERIANAFSDETEGNALMHFSRNPM